MIGDCTAIPYPAWEYFPSIEEALKKENINSFINK
jgi:hypothetical protein